MEKNWDLTNAVFVKSTFSGGNGSCVEVAKLSDGTRAVRHSKVRDGGVLYFTPDEWRAFLAGVRAAEFD